MKCADCKNELRNDSLFCPHCGASVEKAKTRRKKKIRAAVISALCISIVSAAAVVMALMMKNNTSIIGRWVAEDGGVLVFHFDGSFEDGGFDNALPGEYGIYTGVPGLEEVGLGEYQIFPDKTLFLSYDNFKGTKRTYTYKTDWRLSVFGKLYICDHVYSRDSKHKGLNKCVQNSGAFDISTRGASSLAELTEILNEDVLFSSEQIRCMSAGMMAWMWEEMEISIENDNSDVSNEEISQILNLMLTEEAISGQISITGLNKAQPAMTPDFTIAEVKEEFFNVINNELSENPVLKREMLGLFSAGATEAAWVADGTLITKHFEETRSYQFHSDLSSFLDSDLIIYKINGRYFWSYIELF